MFPALHRSEAAELGTASERGSCIDFGTPAKDSLHPGSERAVTDVPKGATECARRGPLAHGAALPSRAARATRAARRS